MSSHHNTPKYYPRCYESHRPLVLGEFKIYGGSCSNPVVKDADIYVGFDLGIARSPKSYPWVAGESFLFHIPDMGVPADPEAFKNLVNWISLQLIAKKVIHLGCIGGHGRTGMVLAALTKVLLGTEDAITYVRENYCVKVVESAQQVAFLHTHFGIKIVKGAKEYDTKIAAAKIPPRIIHYVNDKPVNAPAPTFAIKPVKSSICVFGPEITFSAI